MCDELGPDGQSGADAGRINTAAAAVEFDPNALVADDEFPSMEEAVMLSRGIRTSIVNKSSTGNVACHLSRLKLLTCFKVVSRPIERVGRGVCYPGHRNVWGLAVTQKY